MQESNRERMVAVHAPVFVSRDAAKSGDEFLGAKVTRLGEYRSRRGADEIGNAHPDARRHDARAVAVGGDRRASTLPLRRNLLLAALNAEDLARLQSHLELVSLPLGTVICESRTRSGWAYFPTDGIVSLLYELENGASVEVAVTGNDGMVGTAIFMGGGATTSRAVVRNGGQGYRIPARVLKNEFESSMAQPCASCCCAMRRHSLPRWRKRPCATAAISSSSSSAGCCWSAWIGWPLPR